MEEIITDLVKILLPAAIALFAVYLTVNAFLTNEFEKKILDLKLTNTQLVLPVRLQAYERMLLYLERISPQSLVLRLNNPAYTAVQLQQLIVSEVREEFNHNVSQQLYMSDQAWALVKNTTEEIIGLVNVAANEVEKEAPSLELAKAILEKQFQRSEDPVYRTIRYLKNEIGQVF